MRFDLCMRPSRWKLMSIAVVLLLAALLALPNVFGEDEALQVVRKDHENAVRADEQAVESHLKPSRSPSRAAIWTVAA